jgi:hypothetical protein
VALALICHPPAGLPCRDDENARFSGRKMDLNRYKSFDLLRATDGVFVAQSSQAEGT